MIHHGRTLSSLLIILSCGSLPAQEWNQWRGPLRDGLSPDKDLAREWPESGPPIAWQTTGLGQSFSSVSFYGDKIFTMGDVDGAAKLFALNAADGEIIWSAEVGKPGGVRNPGPRGTPATDGKFVYTLGHDGELVSSDIETGKKAWSCNLISDYGGKMMSRWGYSESPLLDGDLLVVTPGGSNGAVLALNKNSGEQVWRCTEITDGASYASLVPVEIGGIRQYLIFTGTCVAGIDATDGKMLWRGNRSGKTAVCATPVYEDGLLFVTSAYNVGCNAFKISADNGDFQVSEIYAGKQMQNHHGGVVLIDGFIYGIGRRQLKCIELATGKVMWEDNSVGKGSIAYADGHLVVRGEDAKGAIALVEATPDGYREKGRFDQPERRDAPAWAHPVIFGGRLYIRDQGLLLCYDLEERG